MTSSLRPLARAHDELAEGFARLHDSPALVLPNAWDAASARIVEHAGAAAVATTSAGVAWALGSPDGNAVDRDQALSVVARVVAAVGVPVTADIESGLGESADDLAATIRGVLDAGAVGINIEDSGFEPLRPMAAQADRLRVVRDVASRAGTALFVNARIDTYLMSAGEPRDRLAETLRRSEAYLAAGADGIFVPGVLDLGILAQLVAAIPAPLNVLAGSGGPTVTQLRDIGVRRISAGSSLAQAAYDVVDRAARELLTGGTYGALERNLDYGRMNALLAPH